MASQNGKSNGRAPPDTVDAFLARLDHPLKGEIVALRQLLLGIDPAISEEVKWNAPSFRTSAHFATMYLRRTDSVKLILHLGARPKAALPAEAISDPDGLLEWLGPDRASVRIIGMDDLAAKAAPLAALVRQWIQHVQAASPEGRP